jgi:hypothetical protein
MRVEDYGKVAATFVDTLTGRASGLYRLPAAAREPWTMLQERKGNGRASFWATSACRHKSYFRVLRSSSPFPSTLFWESPR